MGDLINRAVRHHIKHVDHPEDPVRRPFQNRAGSIPVLTTLVAPAQKALVVT